MALFVPWHSWLLLSPDTFGTVHYSMVQWHTVLWFPYVERVPGNLKIKNWNEFLKMTTVLYSSQPYCTVVSHTVLYSSQLCCTVLYSSQLYCTHLLIKLFMLGPLDKSLVVVGWHCNYSLKLQGSRGDLESLSLVELDSRPIESNSWTPSLTIPKILKFEWPVFRNYYSMF